MKKILYSILLLCSLGCANIIPPQGGPMDNIAPSIMYGQCIPDSLNLTNYKEKTIVIAINEEFKIQGLNTEMKTNPALIKPVEYKIKKVSKKKSNLIITFQEELKTNTTYTLDFGRSIKDLTENNVLQNPNFVFSTGSFIDSLYIEGQVTDIYSKPIAGTLIGLYSKEDSITPNKHKPVYSTFSDSKGNYSLTHLAEDDYQIFAIADKNKNKNYDIRNEKIGFISSKINPSRDTNKVNFVLFQQKDTVFRITSFKLNSDKTQLKFSSGLKQVSIISETIVSHQLLNNSKTLAIFPHSSDIKESMLHIIAKDSNNNVIDTNIALKFTLDKTLFNSKKDIIKSIETSDNQYFKDSLSFIISINEPLQELLFSNIFIISELDTSMIKNRGTIIHQINENFTKINFKVKANLSDTVKILIKPGLIKGVQGNLNKEKEMTFLPYDKKEYSALKGTITTKETNYIFLLYKDKKVIDKRYNNKEFDYPIMKPGEYSIEIQLDKNKNSKLDNGSFYKKIQPEKVYRYPNKVKLKANWEINNLKVEF